MKQCPKCNVQMTRQEIGSVAVEECGRCGGVWFDRDELRRATDSKDADLKWRHLEIWKHRNQFQTKPSTLKCPACGTGTAIIGYGATRIEVDFCLTCGGTWLDRGEFEKIIRALEEQLATETFSEYVKEAIDEAKAIVTGRESLISEWKGLASLFRLMRYRFCVEHPKLLSAVTGIEKGTPLQ